MAAVLRYTTFVLALAAACALPVALPETYVYLAIEFLIMAVLAVSYNLLFGLTGILSFCHGTLYGAGAYAVAILSVKLKLPLWLAVALAPVAAAALAALLGPILTRTRGMQFAMLSLALGQLVYALVVRQHDLTGGDDGLPIAVPPWLASPTNLYYFSLIVVGASLFMLWRVVHSPFGAALAAVRQNHQRATFLGLNVRRYELAVFVTAGAFAGVAGGLRAILQQAAFPSLLSWTQSAEPLLMTLAGGTGSFFGPVVGSALFVCLNFLITKSVGYPFLVFGVVILLIVLLLPGGLSSLVSRTSRLPLGGNKA
ncbi:branched-chain amino acid ABC transporter permease [Micromonospora sp. STR1s_5]|nr:branched-chain amino acid ABC transporter permease [Micromonospora sp. STR1s_5]